MLSAGDIERKINEKGNPYLLITSSGKTKFKRKFPILSLQKHKWDGTFMVVSFDIEENERYKRDLFRKKLEELGFGQMQKSVWISPFHFEDDIREFIEDKGLADRALVLKAEAMHVGNIKDFTVKIWKIDELDKEYSDLDSEVEKYFGGQSNKKVMELWSRYFEILQNDPFLPEEFLPVNWKGKILNNKMHNLALTKTPRSAV